MKSLTSIALFFISVVILYSSIALLFSWGESLPLHPVDSDKQIKEPIWLTHDSSDEQLCKLSLHSSISKRKEERDWFYHSRPAENLKDTHFATRSKQHAQYRFLRPCWFVSLVGLRQLSFPCHFFWVYLNVRTCNSFSASLARVLRFGFCFCLLYTSPSPRDA